MRRTFRILTGILLLLLLVCGGFLLFLDHLAKQAVERGGSFAMGVPTQLENVSIGLRSGRTRLGGLRVENPPGFEARYFFTLGFSELELSYGALLERHIVIPSLEVESIHLDLEGNASGTNYGVILDNLARFEHGEAEAGEPQEAAPPQRTFTLQRLRIRDIRASIRLLPGGGDLSRVSLTVPEISVDHISTEMTLPQLLATIVELVVQGAVSAGQGVIPEELLADLRSKARALEGEAQARIHAKLGKLGDKLQAEVDQLGPDASQAVKEARDKLDSKLKGLLQPK
jgi:hypothetical protein